MGIQCLKCGRRFPDLDAWDRHLPCRNPREVAFSVAVAIILLLTLLILL